MFKNIISSESARIKRKYRKFDLWPNSLNRELSRLKCAIKSSKTPSKKAIRICKTWKEFLIINYRNLVSKTNQYNIRHNHQSLEERWKFTIISAHNRIRMWYRHRGIEIESKNTFLYNDSNRDWQQLLETNHTYLLKKRDNFGWEKLFRNNATYIRKATRRSKGSSNKKISPTKDWTVNLNNQRDRLKVKESTRKRDWNWFIKNTLCSLRQREHMKMGRSNA